MVGEGAVGDRVVGDVGDAGGGVATGGIATGGGTCCGGIGYGAGVPAGDGDGAGTGPDGTRLIVVETSCVSTERATGRSGSAPGDAVESPSCRPATIVSLW